MWECNPQLDPQVQPYTFKHPGEWVAVYYYDESAKKPTYYIGQVLQITHEHKAVVTFFEQCSMKKNQYRFSSSLDIDSVDSKSVFHSNFLMTTAKARIWTVHNLKELTSLFKQYVNIYC